MQAASTIAAIATPPGRGGIAVTRISGPLALSAARQICRCTPQPRHVYFRKFYDGDNLVDEGVLIYYAAPASYTGEDVIELQGHGGRIAPQSVLNAALRIEGISMAEPGEFTRRAFVNGKLDLSAAEAVEDLISARSSRAARAALASLNGAFALQVRRVDEQLLAFRARLEGCLDFPEEHELFLDTGAALSELETLVGTCGSILLRARQGARLTEGSHLVLTGEPNAGKSSLMNALAMQECAIVSTVPGTTRDVLHAELEIGGVSVMISDTAGLRDSAGSEIEAMGIKRALEQIARADLVLFVMDGTVDGASAVQVLRQIIDHRAADSQLLIIIAKNDLPACQQLKARLEQPPFSEYPQVSCSVRTQGGLEPLQHMLTGMLNAEQGGESACSARLRHCQALQETEEALARSLEMLRHEEVVLCARELRQAHEYLGEITGHTTSDELLGRIFATFCIGK